MRQLLIVVFFFMTIKGLAQAPFGNLREEVKQNVQSGHYSQALSLLENNLASICNDTTGLFDALINLYLFEKNWQRIVNAYAFRQHRQGEDTTTLAIARFNSQYPGEKIILEHPFHIPFKPALGGTPVIDVKVNGKEYRFWFDTGAGMTVLSSSTARECGIKHSDRKNGVAIAATGKALDLNPGSIDSLEINALKVYNHPCIILSKKDLEFRILGIRIFKIDGIIGWNLLQELDVTINNVSEIISLASSAERQSDQHNFFWLGLPLINCTDSSGASFLFFIDTGAGSSGVYKPYLAKADTTNATRKVILMSSAGGSKKIKSFVFPLIKLNAGGKTLEMEHVSLYPYRDKNLFSCDGVLGINEFKNSTINFNVRKGFFAVKN